MTDLKQILKKAAVMGAFIASSFSTQAAEKQEADMTQMPTPISYKQALGLMYQEEFQEESLKSYLYIEQVMTFQKKVAGVRSLQKFVTALDQDEGHQASLEKLRKNLKRENFSSALSLFKKMFAKQIAAFKYKHPEEVVLLGKTIVTIGEYLRTTPEYQMGKTRDLKGMPDRPPIKQGVDVTR